MKFYLYNATQNKISLSDVGIELNSYDNISLEDSQLESFYFEGCLLESYISSGNIILSIDPEKPPLTSFSVNDALIILESGHVAEKIYYNDSVSQLGNTSEVQTAIEKLKTLIDLASTGQINIQKDGVNIENTPHSTLNFLGEGVEVENIDGNIVNISIGFVQNIFGTEYNFSSSEVESSTTSINWIDKVILNIINIPAGRYKIEMYFESSVKSAAVGIKSRVILNNINIMMEQDTGFQDEWTSYSGFNCLDLTAGNHTFNLQYASSNSSQEVKIRRARLEFWRLT